MTIGLTLVRQKKVMPHGLAQCAALGWLIAEQLGNQLKQLAVVLIVRIFQVTL
jgi:hypothetical protein